MKSNLGVILFSAAYLLVGGLYFLQDLNIEFVIYAGVIAAVFLLVALTQKTIQFPSYVLWLISIWGLLHILGGIVPTRDGVLFAYRIYPFIDRGGEFFVLKYDQVVHMYLYGVMSVAFLHIIRRTLGAVRPVWIIFLTAILAAMGVGALNEIMEFFIAITLARNGVGGYENTLLDLVFNFSGAVVAMGIVLVSERVKNSRVIIS